MSKHVPRHARWSKHGPNEYRCGGAAVRYEKGAWWAWVSYQQRDEPVPGELLPPGQPHCDRLGPFKRPRNAMMAAEEHALILSRRHGENLTIDPLDPKKT